MPADMPKLWSLKLELEYSLKEKFQELFPDISHLKRPKELERLLLYNPRLLKMPILPMTVKAKSSLKDKLRASLHLSERVEANYVLFQRNPEEDAIISEHAKSDYKRKESFMREVLGRFLQDYAIRLLPTTSEFKVLAHLNLATKLQESLSFLTQVTGFSELEGQLEPPTMGESHKKAIITLFNGLDRFFKHYAIALKKEPLQPILITIEEERARDDLPPLFKHNMTPIQADEVLVDEISLFIQAMAPNVQEKPEMQIFINLGATLIASNLNEFIDKGGIHVLIDHLITTTFEASALGPSPSFTQFSAKDEQFSKVTGQLIKSIAETLFAVVPATGVLGYGIGKASELLQEKHVELGVNLQKIINSIFSTPDRTGIFFGVSQILWKRENNELIPLLPDFKKGKQLKRTQELLKTRVLEFMMQKISHQIEAQSTKVFTALEFLKIVGVDFITVRGQLSKYLGEWMEIVFKLLDDKLLLLTLLGYLNDDLRCKKQPI